MVEAGRHLLSFYPQTPPSSGKAGFCLFCSLPLLRVFVGWGVGKGGSRVSHSSRPLYCGR